MKNFVIIIFLIIGNALFSQNPQEKYESNLKIIEQWLNLKEGESINGNDINDASIFFKSLTGRGCKWVNDFEPTAMPTKEDFDFWKKWYQRNKENLYWDEKSESVKVKKGNTTANRKHNKLPYFQ